MKKIPLTSYLPLCIVGLLAWAMPAQRAEAGKYLIEEDWESWSNNTVLTKSGTTWTDPNYANWANNIKTLTVAQSAFTPGSMGVRVNDPYTGWGPKLNGTFSRSTSDAITVEFDYYIDSANAEALVALSLGGIDLKLYSNGNLVNVAGSTYTTLTEISLDTWYHVVMDVAEAGTTYTYDMSITPYGGSTISFNSLGFRNTTSTSYSSMQFIAAGNNPDKSSTYLDNIYVSIPESDYAALYSTLAVILLGVIGRKRFMKK